MKKFIKIGTNIFAEDNIDFIDINDSELPEELKGITIVCHTKNGWFTTIKLSEDFNIDNFSNEIEENYDFIAIDDTSNGDKYLINMNSVLSISEIEDNVIKIIFSKNNLYLFYNTREQFETAFDLLTIASEV